jgi:hypothetical protein
VWGYGARYMQETLDLVIANHDVKTNVDLYHLDQDVRSGHLVGRVNSTETVKTYLEWFRDTFDVDFIPTQTPKDRWTEFPFLPRDVLKRYVALD